MKKYAKLLPQDSHIARHNEGVELIKVENCVGFAQVPIGLAGPLQIHGRHQTYNDGLFAPLATIEATLVASCSRGCKLLQSCGGVQAVALDAGMARAPAFKFRSINDAVYFSEHINDFQARLKASAESTSRFAKLVKLTPNILGSWVHVKFQYATGDAGGQNMTTIATHKACTDFIASAEALEFKIIDFCLEGQMASDKKLSWSNVFEPRGIKVLAWATITNEACRKVMGLTTFRLHQTIEMGATAAVRGGMLGHSINTSNIMAALFIACGQDSASVLEGGWAQLISELDPATQDLTLSVFFPSMPLGTVGGGTMYPTQKECLGMLKCYGEGKKLALAETIAGFALALDISTVAAMGNDTFSQAHKSLARDSKI